MSDRAKTLRLAALPRPDAIRGELERRRSLRELFASQQGTPSQEEARRLLDRWVTRNPFIPVSPHARQAEFLMLSDAEALYGGAAGGGKSAALLMAALMFVEIAGYSALLVRETYPELVQPSGLIPTAQSWLQGRATWREQTKSFTFPSSATLTFGHMQHENDKYNYKGGAYQFIGWDELTHFSETQYRYMFSRTRKLATMPAPVRVRGTANPEGRGIEWVKQRFLTEKRAFVPARLADNPSLDREEYEASLQHLDPVTRARLLSGDWEMREKGALFDRVWFPTVEVPPADVRRIVRYWDLASTEMKPGKDPDWTAGGKIGVTRSGKYVVLDVTRRRESPSKVEDLIKATATLDGRDVEVWIEQEPGSAGVAVIDNYVRRVLPGYTVRGWKETGNKVLRASPCSSQAEAGNVSLLRGPWIGAFLDELEAFPQGGHDDQVDCFTGALGRLMGDGGPAVSAVVEGEPTQANTGDLRANYGARRRLFGRS